MNSFFAFETEFTGTDGFPLFGFCHLLWLAILFGIGVVSTLWFVRCDLDRQKQVLRVVGTFMPFMELYRDIVLIVTGHFDVGFLPLHLCSLSLIIACIYGWTFSKLLGSIYLGVCVPGAIAALLFPNWTMYPVLNYMHIHAFLAHGLTVIVGGWLFCSGLVIPKWREFWKLIVFGGVGFLVIGSINKVLKTNFWFVEVPSADSPLIWIYQHTSANWYCVGYFLFCFVVITIWQGLLWVSSNYVKFPYNTIE